MQQQPQRSISPIEGLIVVGLVFWLLFMGGFSALKSAKVGPTLQTGVQRLVGTAAAAATQRPISLTSPSTTGNRSAGRDVKLPNPSARGAGAGASTTSNDQAQPTATAGVPTAVSSQTPLPLVAGGAAPAEAAAPPAALGYSVPTGQHTNINPDGSFTVDNGKVRYYPNSESVIVDVRLEGSEDYLQRITPEVPTATAVYIAPTRLPNAEACRRGCPKRTPTSTP